MKRRCKDCKRPLINPYWIYCDNQDCFIARRKKQLAKSKKKLFGKK